MHERNIRRELAVLREHVGPFVMMFYGIPVDAMSHDELTALVALLFRRLSYFDPIFTGTKCRSEDECPVYSGGGHKYVASNGQCVCKCGAALP